jgi:hypothetical protein
MFDPDTVDSGLYKRELTRLGLGDWIQPLERWFIPLLPIAWIEVCQRCDPRNELLCALEFVTALDCEGLISILIGLRAHRLLISMRGNEPPYAPFAESWEDFVFRSAAVRELPELTQSAREQIRDSLLDAWTTYR